jgi:hypothetical protein
MVSGDSSFHDGPPIVAASPKPQAPLASQSCTITGLCRLMAPNENLCGRIVGMSTILAWMRSMRQVASSAVIGAGVETDVIKPEALRE